MEPSAILIIGLMGFVGWALYAGPDLNFDFLNYHLYAGLHADGDSIARDFFPAGASSYLSPYAYWPVAAMVAAKWPGMLVGAGLAAIHSLAVFATWYLSRQLVSDDSRKAVTLRCAATGLGIICPLVLTEVGTSFIDITTAIPCVLGMALLLKALGATCRRTRLFAVSGLCFGVATALKLTNAPYAVAASLSMGILWMFRSEFNWRNLIVFGVAEIAGFVAGYGYWGWQLWQEFGNPVFPFFNSIFQSASPAAGVIASSPPALPSSLWDGLSNLRASLHQRYLPHGFGEWLLRPLYMVDPVADVYTEVRAPDARFFALFCLAPFAVWMSRAQVKASNLVALLLFFIIAWVLWMGLFGNGRYLMPLALMAGPALVGCANACWPRRNMFALSAITVFFLVQVALLTEGTQFRWAGSAWQSYWIVAKLPHAVTDRPATFVTLEGPSASWLSAFVHPSSRFVFPGGLPMQSGSGKGSDKFSRLLEQSPDIIAVFTFGYFHADTEKPYPSSPRHLNAMATRIGLQVDFDACMTGNLVESKPELLAQFVRDGADVKLLAVPGLFFCRATYRPELRRDLPLDPLREAAFKNIEQACPGRFPPGSVRTICADNACWRIYSSTDMLVNISSDGAVTARRYSAFQQPYLGKVDELARDASGIECYSDLGRYVPWSPGANLLARPQSPK